MYLTRRKKVSKQKNAGWLKWNVGKNPKNVKGWENCGLNIFSLVGSWEDECGVARSLCR